MKSAVWWTTWKCNYKCEYCWQVQGQQQGHYLPGKLEDEHLRWLAAWKRLHPDVLDITGGEPFLVPGLVDCLAGLHHTIKLAITTNLSHDVGELIEKVPPDHFLQVTCSLHPSQPRFNEVLFYGRALQLQKRGYPVMLNFVGWPEQLWIAELYQRISLERGLRFHFDPYAPSYNPAPKWSERELAEITRLRGPDRTPHPWTAEFGQQYTVNCSGGMDHLSVHPDGTAYRCILDQQLGLPAVGNVFDEAFTWGTAKTPCHEHWRCPGCDRDKVTVELATPPRLE
jgi:MoaA/NifB/PqqE/SkfB family radical SAM enzyme